MKYILYFLYFSYILGFKINFKKNSFLLCCNKKNNEDINYIKEVKIINIDFNKMIDDFDNEVLARVHNNTVPLSPQTEDEIEDDSFEGYLRSNFRNITTNDKINFNEFYQWRKYKIGTVLTIDEVKEIFFKINEIDDCSLMNFILLNKIIDENDGADF